MVGLAQGQAHFQGLEVHSRLGRKHPGGSGWEEGHCGGWRTASRIVLFQLISHHLDHPLESGDTQHRTDQCWGPIIAGEEGVGQVFAQKLQGGSENQELAGASQEQGPRPRLLGGFERLKDVQATSRDTGVLGQTFLAKGPQALVPTLGTKR